MKKNDNVIMDTLLQGIVVHVIISIGIVSSWSSSIQCKRFGSRLQVITHCVRSFVDTQLHFFQSAAGQLAQFSSNDETTGRVGVPEPFDLFAGSSRYVSHQVAIAGDDGPSVAPSNFLNRPPGLSVSPQRTSPQITAEKNQRSAGLVFFLVCYLTNS